MEYISVSRLGHKCDSKEGAMLKSRRQFLTGTSLALLGAAGGCRSKPEKTGELPPGAPHAFGTATAVGPEVSAATLASEKQKYKSRL
jgi:hypothetical protein